MTDQGYAEIDVSEWSMYGEEDLGTKPKRWLVNPETEERWLMKDATFSEGLDGNKYRKGDDWAERIAFGVAQVLRLPAARVEIALNRRGKDPVYGTVCRTVLGPDEGLISGDELMGEYDIDVSRNRRELYTVEAAFRVLRDVEPPVDVADNLTASTVFVGYLVLDALIGNTDRHEENWCVINPAEAGSPRRLSPTFDHASSLGFLLSDQDRRERLSSKDGNRTPEGYADRAKTPFASKPHPIAVVDSATQLTDRSTAEYWLGQVEHVDDLIIPIWAIPEHRMSTPAREFAERVLRHNWSRMAA